MGGSESGTVDHRGVRPVLVPGFDCREIDDVTLPTNDVIGMILQPSRSSRACLALQIFVFHPNPYLASSALADWIQTTHSPSTHVRSRETASLEGYPKVVAAAPCTITGHPLGSPSCNIRRSEFFLFLFFVFNGPIGFQVMVFLRVVDSLSLNGGIRFI